MPGVIRVVFGPVSWAVQAPPTILADKVQAVLVLYPLALLRQGVLRNHMPQLPLMARGSRRVEAGVGKQDGVLRVRHQDGRLVTAVDMLAVVLHFQRQAWAMSDLLSHCAFLSSVQQAY